MVREKDNQEKRPLRWARQQFNAMNEVFAICGVVFTDMLNNKGMTTANVQQQQPQQQPINEN